MRSEIKIGREVALVPLHLGVVIASLILGWIFSTPVEHGLERVFSISPSSPWLDVPYDPLIWGSSLVAGGLINLWLRSRSASWMWTVGVFWLLVGMTDEFRFHDPRWCGGCSLGQDVWNQYFAWDKNKCSNQECLGQLLFTTPLLCSIAYSVAGTLARRWHRSSAESD